VAVLRGRFPRRTAGSGDPAPPEGADAHDSYHSGAGHKLTGDTTFGHLADAYALVPATSGPCHGDADVGQTIVDKATRGRLRQVQAGLFYAGAVAAVVRHGTYACGVSARSFDQTMSEGALDR
jgi:hypothetical protein